MNRKNKGFTLIELLVVIAIIGILATIVLVSLNTARSKSRDTRRVADVRQIALALEMYYDENRAYPCDGTDNDDDLASLAGLSPNFMASVPVDPIAGGAYRYSPDGTALCQDYVLGAQLENATSAALRDDIDGAAVLGCTVAGCNCDDNDGVSPDTNMFYCIQP